MRHIVLLLAVALAFAASAAPVVRRTNDHVVVRLDSGAELGFALQGDLLLGLQTASVGGTALKSPATCLRPILAEDYGLAPVLCHALRLDRIEELPAGVALHCTLLATREREAFRRIFVMAPDYEHAKTNTCDGGTPELFVLRGRADSGANAIASALAGVPQVGAARSATLLKQAALATASPREQKALQREVDALVAVQTQTETEARTRLIAASAELQAAQAAADAYQRALDQRALDQRALELAKVHRDYHRFPMLRLPAEACTRERMAELATLVPRDQALAVGTLTWTLTAEEANIAGWPWAGWRQQYAVHLEEGYGLNSIRQMGTWELGGDAAGLTAVSVRYRGLGGFEQSFAAGPDGGVTSCWTTTETLPGAVGGAPRISPVVPDSVTINDRGYGLRHRAGAWIARLARGAGAGFVDFQYRPDAAFCSFPVRQGNLRALTEIFPGDRTLSQTDEELFATTRDAETTPQCYLVLRVPDTLTRQESRTRWQEVDQYVRDLVSRELGFVQYEPLPAVGANFDSDFGGRVARLAASAKGLADIGVRQYLVHHPGWVNGRALREGASREEGIPYTGGGDCIIYDWTPLTQVAPKWKELQATFSKRGIAYYVWIGAYNQVDAPFAKSVGWDWAHWSVKADGNYGTTTPVLMHNYLDPTMRRAVVDRLETARQDYGFQGFWVDSFHSSGMHRFTPDDRRAPQQRATWEMMAAWSRKGVGLMGEGHAFPGQSCSLEVGDQRFEDAWWALPYTVRWYRGGGNYPDRGTPAADRLAFRVMANKAWACPEARDVAPETIIPSFSRLAHEYLAALPTMRRSYLLAGDLGVLWLPFDSESEGVYFAFSAGDLPAGVTGAYILDNAPVTAVEAHKTYRVRAADLPAAFGVRRGPLPDPRRGRPYAPPAHTWPAYTAAGG